MVQILVIDDEASLRALLRSLLEAQGYEVVEAANGTAGLQCYVASVSTCNASNDG
jgi:CheY-like chemotaxis protein